MKKETSKLRKRKRREEYNASRHVSLTEYGKSHPVGIQSTKSKTQPKITVKFKTIKYKEEEKTYKQQNRNG